MKLLRTPSPFIALSKDNALSVLDIGNEKWRGAVKKVDGYVLSILTITEDKMLHPDLWERHTNGDEFLYVISGEIKITSAQPQMTSSELCSGQGCIVPKGEWHRLNLITPATLLFLTPTQNTERKPVADEQEDR